jgi:hypothetical protein
MVVLDLQSDITPYQSYLAKGFLSFVHQAIFPILYLTSFFFTIIALCLGRPIFAQDNSLVG